MPNLTTYSSIEEEFLDRFSKGREETQKLEHDSIQRANYWSLMSLVDIFYDVLGGKDDSPLTPDFMDAIRILETNLKIELFTDEDSNND